MGDANEVEKRGFVLIESFQRERSDKLQTLFFEIPMPKFRSGGIKTFPLDLI